MLKSRVIAGKKKKKKYLILIIIVWKFRLMINFWFTCSVFFVTGFAVVLAVEYQYYDRMGG